MSNPFTNIPEDGREITATIYDKLGDAYTIYGDLYPNVLLSFVHSKIGCVGRINWDTSQSGIMDIADLIIFDEPLTKKPFWASILPFLYKPPDYKGRGLGSAMLKFIIASAQKMNVTKITGRITDDDLEKTPFLPTFYSKHGFTINDRNQSFYMVLD